MSTLDMPDRPHLDSFRRQARVLQRAVRAGEPDAVARLARHYRGAVPNDTSGLQLTSSGRSSRHPRTRGVS